MQSILKTLLGYSRSGLTQKTSSVRQKKARRQNRHIQNSIWEMLDEHEVPFRKTKAEWVTLFGSSVSQDSRGQYSYCCVPDENTFFRGLKVQLGFLYRVTDDMTVVPDRLTGSFQKFDDSYENLSSVKARLTSLLGAGTNFSGNHVGSSWTAGRARVAIHVHPPELNEPYLSGEPYCSQPALITQCHIDVEPEWYNCVPDDIFRLLPDYEQWFTCLPKYQTILRSGSNRFVWPDAVTLPPRGFGILGSRYVVVLDYQKIFHLIEVARITELRMDGRYAARCAADCVLSVLYTLSNDRIAEIDLVPIYKGNHTYYQDLGESFAKRIGVPFGIRSFPSE